MSNSKRGMISFETDGQELSLRFTVSRLVEYHDEFGTQVLDDIMSLEKSPSDVKKMQQLFWGALFPRSSIEGAGEIIDEIGISRAVSLIGKAASAAFSDKGSRGKDGKTADPRPALPKT